MFALDGEIKGMLYFAPLCGVYAAIFFGLIRFEPWGRTTAKVLSYITIVSPFSRYVLWGNEQD